MIGQLVALCAVAVWVLVVCSPSAPPDVRRVLCSLWRAWNIESPGQGQNVIAPLCTLSVAISAGLVALITFLRETGLTQLVYMGYLVVAILIPWLIMICLVTAKTSTGVRYADWLSLRLGAGLVFVFLLLGTIVVIKGSAGTLPNQPVPRARSIKASEALPYAGIAPTGIVAIIQVDDVYPRGGIPDRMNFVFDLQEPLLSRWEIWETRVEIIDDQGRTVQSHPFPTAFVDGTRRHAQSLVLHSDATKHYQVKMFLGSTKEYDKDQIEKDATIIREGRGVRISDRSDISSN